MTTHSRGSILNRLYGVSFRLALTACVRCRSMAVTAGWPQGAGCGRFAGRKIERPLLRCSSCGCDDDPERVVERTSGNAVTNEPAHRFDRLACVVQGWSVRLTASSGIISVRGARGEVANPKWW